MATFRIRKLELAQALAGDDWRGLVEEVRGSERPKLYVDPLIAHLLHTDEVVRWRAVVVLGEAVRAVGALRTEDARIIMRRFMWHLNEESGNLGWGIGEAMGESMARERVLAREYHRILLSYVTPEREPDELGAHICHGNFLEHPPLRHGILWGLWRVCAAWPALLVQAGAAEVLLLVLAPGSEMEGREGTVQGLECHDAMARGLACLALGGLREALDAPCRAVVDETLSQRLTDRGAVRYFTGDDFVQTTVSSLAAGARAE